MEIFKFIKKINKSVNRLKSREYWLLKRYKFTTVQKFSLDCFTGKRVAIIGPADSALKEKAGGYIDGFDIVIRINKSIDMVNVYSEYIGSKTTFLFHGLDETPKTGCGNIETELWKKYGVNGIFYPLNEKRFQANLNNCLLKNKGVLPLFQIDEVFYNKLRSDISNFTPTTGFAALYILLHSQCSELYISGFTFFKTPHQRGYRNDLANHHEARKLMKEYGNHNPDIEFEVFKNLIHDSNLNIMLDSTLKSLVYDDEN
ncbi:MAG: glycosyltransferase family 29 protein [Flavobacterium sp.]